MKIRKTKDIERLLADERLIQKALAKGVREALHRHELAGLPVVQWRNGKVVWVSPRRPRVVRARA
jgi:hypothetical protein